MNWLLIGGLVVVVLIILIVIGVIVYFITRPTKSCTITGCPENTFCSVDGGCIPDGSCAGNGDCGENQICEDGRCRTVAGPPEICQANGDCPTGLVCRGNICTNGCATTTDCGPGTVMCIRGRCQLKACNVNFDCGVNEACLENTSGDSFCVGNITCQGNCPGGLKCIDGICRQCSSPNDGNCPFAACFRGACSGCIPPAPGEPEYCATGQTCNRLAFCCPTQGQNQPCKVNTDCPSTNPYCIASAGTCNCRLLPEGSFCVQNTDCANGSCVKGRCNTGECWTSADCPTGQFCSPAGFCTGNILGSACRVPRDAAVCLTAGNYCVDGICQRQAGGYGASCRVDTDCQPGYLCRANPKVGGNRLFCTPGPSIPVGGI